MLTIPALLQNSVEKHKHRLALSFVGEKGLTYEALALEIELLSKQLLKKGLGKDDKIAILSSNMPNWGVAYFAILKIGAVAVPLLPDFSSIEIQNILVHSESKAIFVSQNLNSKIASLQTEHLAYTIDIETLEIKTSHHNKITLDENTSICEVKENDLAVIIYTSGTTGKSKGVMLSHKNLCSNAIQGHEIQPLGVNDRMLSILPLSHTYENTLGLLLSMFNGVSVFYLKKPPTPSVLMPALAIVKPTAILSVPLIIEKIYRSKILPTVQKNLVLRSVYKLGVFRKLIHRLMGKKLMKSFGGELTFFGIGGAKLNKEVEQFLREAKFPYAIGYGLTETAPLLAGVDPAHTVLQSTGPCVINAELKIYNPNPTNGEGEIWVKGPNVMQGYYKEPELTKQVLTDDGWFKTGDLGVFDKNNYLFIKGRTKNVIIGASGENIYPEEIESVINNFRFVLESVVIEQKGKLVALVHFNKAELESKYQDIKNEMEIKVDELLLELKAYLDLHLNKFSRVQLVLSHPDPFQKTATHKIKRYLYTSFSL